MVLVTPKSGKTYCTITSGKFSDTYDGSTSTSCGFITGVTCLSEWYLDNPSTVDGIRIHSKNYDKDNYLYKVWCLIGSSWSEIWSGTLNLPNNSWYYFSFTPQKNCTGIRIGQYNKTGAATPYINEVSIDYIPEGMAGTPIVDVPSEFVPSVPFTINATVSNDGGTDDIFAQVRDRDTQKVLSQQTANIVGGGKKTFSFNITLTQTTDFRGKVEAGHVV